VDLYFVGVAGDGKQDTFYSEMVSIKDLLDERFDTAGRSIGLVNNPATLKDYPIATVSNLRSTLAHLGNTINTDEDIVLLHIAPTGATTTGSRWICRRWSSRSSRDRPRAHVRRQRHQVEGDRDLGLLLGGLHRAAQGRQHLIITAADAFHSSFGCEYDSDYTWFSQAFYDEALSETFFVRRGVRGGEGSGRRPGAG